MSALILVVDDEAIQRSLIAVGLEGEGFNVITASSGSEAVELLRSDKGQDVDLLLLDLMMPGLNGIEVLRSIRPRLPNLPVIVLTSENSTRVVVEAMRAGATDFLVKPVPAARLRQSIESALKGAEITNEISRIKGRNKNPITFDSLIGESEAMRRAVDLARKGAASNIPILIEGESGVGKEVFARAIQAASDRANMAFVAVNCGAIPENLVESILFGHEKGAFTGATDKHDGKFVEATGGTLFLDEIGELPMDIQVKLLRAIQEGEVDPVGSRKPVKVDIRLISATNKTLIQRVGEGMFREDLLYRLNVFPIRIPPLRERPEDIPLLVEHFATGLAKSEGRPVRTLTPRAMDLLTGYDWPGNVRQLENAIFRAVILADGDEIDIEDFPQIVNGSRAVDSGRSGRVAAEPQASAADGEGVPLVDDEGHIRPLSEIESDVIRLALEKYNGQMSEIARRLGIGRSTLYRKVDEIGLQGYPHSVGDRRAI